MTTLEAIEKAIREGRATETRCSAFPSSTMSPPASEGWSRLVASAGIGTLQLPPDIREAPFQKIIIDRAHELNWICAHFRTSLNMRGEHQTAVGADGKGFFDLVLMRERVIYVEVKRQKGVQSDEQKMWAKRAKAAGCEVYLFRPADLELIEQVLTLHRPAMLPEAPLCTSKTG